jgi:hypothetical protein
MADGLELHPRLVVDTRAPGLSRHRGTGAQRHKKRKKDVIPAKAGIHFAGRNVRLNGSPLSQG